MNPRGGNWQEIQERLRLQVEQAMAELKRVNAERERLLGISADVCDGPDGAVAAQQAMRLQREAAFRLCEALRRFAAFSSETRG